MTEGLDLHLGVDKGAGFVGRALETSLREAIRSGRLHAGARLPGSRSLAADLGISRGTVVQAYAQLIAEGWLTGTTGSGTRVADLPGPGPATAGDDPAPAAARLAVDLRPGRPDLSSFPRTDWASSVRRALSAAAYEDLDYAEPAGLPVLRAAVAGYVTRARGVRADAGAVVITAGFTPGLALLGRVLHRLGMRAIATEDVAVGAFLCGWASGMTADIAMDDINWGMTIPSFVGIVARCGSAPPGGVNSGWYCNPEVDKLLDAAVAEPDEAKAREIYQKANKLIMDDAAFIPVVDDMQPMITAPSVKGFVNPPNDWFDFSTVWIEG